MFNGYSLVFTWGGVFCFHFLKKLIFPCIAGEPPMHVEIISLSVGGLGLLPYLDI